MKHLLYISEDLKLPLDFVTQTAAILARKRVGKTYTASVIAEEMVKAELPFVALDPTGAWWGLRASADGKSEGLPVVIIGGAHGDVPLEVTAGKVIADLVVDHPGYYVIDLSQTKSNAEQDRFATDFAERLYRYKEQHPFPLHLFIDEADSFAPQKPFKGQERMLGAFEALVRRGGIRGIGMTMITQRPAVLNKNVLTQIEMLIVLQMTAPQDQNAIDDWVSRNGTKEQRDEMMASLASLKKGDAWFWSPSWLEIFKRVHVRERHTFNSSATPKAGEKVVIPQRLAKVDLEKLGEEIQATIERARADDPKELKRQIAELNRKMTAQVASQTVRVEPQIQRVEVPVLNGELPKLQGLIGELREVLAPLNRLPDALTPLMDTLNLVGIKVELVANAPKAVTLPTVSATTRHMRIASPAASPKIKSVDGDTEIKLRAGERKILQMLAQYHPKRLTNAQVGTLTRFPSTGKTYETYKGVLKRNGLIAEYADGLEITERGFSFVGQVPDAPQSHEELFAEWSKALRAGEREILKVALNAHPHWVSLDALRDRFTQFTGKTLETYIGVLRRNELIETNGAAIRASDSFFMLP